MRKLKFRAWNKKNKEMEYEFSLDSDGSRVFTQEGSPDFFYPEPYEDIEHKTWILMQFTGLKDKNGKEIYEGDIVKFDRRIGSKISFGLENWIIEWSNRTASFRLCPSFIFDQKYESSLGISKKFRDMEIYKVVGNIYENPNLLQENK